jgi:hypothetical protein
LPLLLSQALQRANTAVFEEGRADRSRRGMGTNGRAGPSTTTSSIWPTSAIAAPTSSATGRRRRSPATTPAFEMHRQRLLTEAEIA